MSADSAHAPLWRRCAAAAYDGLLLMALWMTCALIVALVRGALGRSGVAPTALMQAVFFAVGLAFFGWFWTHGGQTLGMRVWRLRVQRLDGAPLRWPIAAVRYAGLLASWGVALTPALLQVPNLRALPQSGTGAALAGSAVVLAIALSGLDPRRRLPHDWIAGTEVRLAPKSSDSRSA